MIENTNSKVTYVADGNTNSWAIPFQFINEEDILLYVSDDTIDTKITSNYSFNEQKTAIIYPTPESSLPYVETGKKVTVIRKTPQTQEEDSSLIHFTSQDVERSLDKLTMITQELQEESGRSLKFSLTASGEEQNVDSILEDINEAASQAGAYASLAQDASNAAVSTLTLVNQAKTETEEAASDAQEALEDCQEIKDGLEKYSKQEYVFVAGTPEGSYTGSLTQIDLGTDLSNKSVSLYLNGLKKNPETEYAISGSVITMTFEMVADSIIDVILGDMQMLANYVDVTAAISQHNNDSQSHPNGIAGSGGGGSSYVLPAATSTTLGGIKVGSGLSVTSDGTLSASGGSGTGDSNWWTVTDDYYTPDQLSTGLSNGKSGSYSLGAYASKEITRIEAWAGNGTEGNPYFRLPWSYGWHKSGNFIYLYYVRPGVSLSWSEFYTGSQINVVTRAYYK